MMDRDRTGLDDPRALDILTTEHWSLLSTRTLGYQEMFGRATMFIGVLSGAIVGLALLAQATHFGRETLAFALVLFSVTLFIGIATFARSVAINYEDARWLAGMALLRSAYLQMVPELKPFFVSPLEAELDERSLPYGSPQRVGDLARSLTTTSSVVAALNSALAGALVMDIAALAGVSLPLNIVIGGAVSIVSALIHVRYAARFRKQHATAK
jgi:hypothetical protein